LMCNPAAWGVYISHDSEVELLPNKRRYKQNDRFKRSIRLLPHPGVDQR
jgi:hypothetical protein